MDWIAFISMALAGLSLIQNQILTKKNKKTEEQQKVPLLQITDIDVSDRRDELLKYVIRNHTVHAAQIIFVQHQISDTPPQIESNPIRIFRGRRFFMPPLGHRTLPSNLRGFLVVNYNPIEASFSSPALRFSTNLLYFFGKIFYEDRQIEKVYVYSFIVELMFYENGRLHTKFIKNENREYNNENAINGDAPNANFDDWKNG